MLDNVSDAGDSEKKQHRREAEVLAIVSALLLVLASLGSSPWRRVIDVRALPNDNRVAAGALRGRVLTLHLEARLAMWHPDGDDAPGALLPAFAEEGRAPQIPGPLIRVPAGTDIVVSVRNVLPRDTLVVRGLHDRAGASVAAAPAAVRLAPGELRVLHFRLETPGTYYYWGTTTGRDINFRTGEDAQLTGAIVVDSSRGRRVIASSSSACGQIPLRAPTSNADGYWPSSTDAPGHTPSGSSTTSATP